MCQKCGTFLIDFDEIANVYYETCECGDMVGEATDGDEWLQILQGEGIIFDGDEE